ncbi:hypothetical protein L665_04501 [Ralstonia solanacearum SD54]|uniref:Uncharacterized protein n=1 Tax=Ralstonia solanacearum TaxID=305 RepID=A0A0S4WI11_RALSL|nr:2-dehydro-3-deoxygluconokinase [Ralstonia solanacearum]ESS50356.1 hypothetical protein L665_04501 [Ralstonia solanacearum SD54]CUV19299.1 conserved exported protein of unknown function [Ralstonia solanacearum]CUV46344.1 conserved exported protein of unknown function [Ralstonia solanacearum]CUV55891.1 conserved exported protein of unknown function [Ralstonia solanacearum]
MSSSLPFSILMMTWSSIAPILVSMVADPPAKCTKPKAHQAQFPHHLRLPDFTTQVVGAAENGWAIQTSSEWG